MVGTSITTAEVCIAQLCFSQKQGCLSKVVCWCSLSWFLSVMGIKLRFLCWGQLQVTAEHPVGHCRSSCQSCWSRAEFLPTCLISREQRCWIFPQNHSWNLSRKGKTPHFIQSQEFRRLEKKIVNCYFYQLDRDQLFLPYMNRLLFLPLLMQKPANSCLKMVSHNWWLYAC